MNQKIYCVACEIKKKKVIAEFIDIGSLCRSCFKKKRRFDDELKKEIRKNNTLTQIMLFVLGVVLAVSLFAIMNS